MFTVGGAPEMEVMCLKVMSHFIVILKCLGFKVHGHRLYNVISFDPRKKLILFKAAVFFPLL